MSDYDRIAHLTEENERLRETLRRLYVVARNRMPNVPTLDEVEIVNEAHDALREAK